MNAPEGDGWEAVYMVYDFHDCPRSGVANFQGNPHAYRAIWDAESDDYSDIYELSPIDANHLEAVKEAWQIWLRWSSANANNTLGLGDDHPALAIDRQRHEELQELVSEALRIDPESSIRAIPTFRSEAGKGFQVRWNYIG
jgi:hypothetical protein